MADELVGIVEYLTSLAAERNLVQRARQGCSTFIENTKRDGGLPAQLQQDKIRMEFRRHSLIFESAQPAYAYIDTMLDLFIDDEEIGYYRLITCLNDEVDDDYLVFY